MKSLIGTKTEQNLSMSIEIAKADIQRNKIFAREAECEGFKEISDLFRKKVDCKNKVVEKTKAILREEWNIHLSEVNKKKSNI